MVRDGADIRPILETYRAHWEGRLGVEVVEEEDRILSAFHLAADAHTGQTRRSGDPYITHPVAVTKLLADAGADADTICAGLLHDVVEDTPISREQIADQFGETVAHIVDGVTKIQRIDAHTGKKGSREESQAATVRKMVIATAQDPRVLIVKLADRLHNLTTIRWMSPEAQRRIAEQTLQIYAPLAARMGIETWKHQLEDIAFPIAHPEEHAHIDQLIRARQPHRDKDLEEVKATLQQAFRDAGLEGRLEGREKHHYSIWRKMVGQRRSFEDIYDIIGLRYICGTVADCYTALGVAHATYTPVAGRFFDHIAMPKPNGYQSLHTTLIGPGGAPFELQIRTEEMDYAATYGAAAHWNYKEEILPEEKAARRAAWQAKKWRRPAVEDEEAREEPDTLQYVGDLVQELGRGEEIYVLTPKGEPVALPAGSTPIDFAYRIHTDIGHACRGARINSRLTPLDTQLQTGDIVEIITTTKPDPEPSRRWLEIAKTSRARQKIRRRLEAADDARYIEEGRKALNKLPVIQAASRREVTTAAAEIAAALGYADIDGMLRAVGAGRISVDSIERRFRRLLQPADEERKRKRAAGSGAKPVIVDGWDNVDVRYAACCEPEPGDDIIGYVTVGRGVSVHVASCDNVANFDVARIVPVSWTRNGHWRHTSWIQVEAPDRTGLLSDVAGAISLSGGNILGAHARAAEDGIATLRFQLQSTDPQHLEEILEAIQTVAGVISAQIEAR